MYLWFLIGHFFFSLDPNIGTVEKKLMVTQPDVVETPLQEIGKIKLYYKLPLILSVKSQVSLPRHQDEPFKIVP